MFKFCQNMLGVKCRSYVCDKFIVMCIIFHIITTNNAIFSTLLSNWSSTPCMYIFVDTCVWFFNGNVSFEIFNTKNFTYLNVSFS